MPDPRVPASSEPRPENPEGLDPKGFAAAAEALCADDECDLRGKCAACQHEAKWACLAYVEATK